MNKFSSLFDRIIMLEYTFYKFDYFFSFLCALGKSCVGSIAIVKNAFAYLLKEIKKY